VNRRRCPLTQLVEAMKTGRCRTNGVERDHGFLKERLRPMRGLKSVASAAIFMRGHAPMR
jgi:transposase-like protein